MQEYNYEGQQQQQQKPNLKHPKNQTYEEHMTHNFVVFWSNWGPQKKIPFKYLEGKHT